MGLPAGREIREINSLLDGTDAAEGDERGMGLPAGRENRKILSLPERDGATEGDVEGNGLPAGREIRKILSLLDGESRLAGGDDGVRGRIGRRSRPEKWITPAKLGGTDVEKWRDQMVSTNSTTAVHRDDGNPGKTGL